MLRAASAFHPDRLRSIRLLFDKSVAGTIILDDVGLNPAMDPKYLAAPVKP